MEKVLVTGATGYIGLHCIHQLLNQGYAVNGSVRSPERKDEIFEALKDHNTPTENLSIFTFDLNDDEGWDQGMDGCDYLLHVASPIALENHNEDFFVKPAVAGVKRAMKFAKKHNVKKVVLTSSVAAIFETIESKSYYDESDWSDPDSPAISHYAKSKTLAEKTAWEFVENEKHPFELTVINPALVIGPSLSGDLGESNKAIVMVATGKMPVAVPLQFGYVDVRDVATAHILAMQNPASSHYAKSKTLAEKTAWEFVENENHPFELTVINPALVIGPSLSGDLGESNKAIVMVATGKMPVAVPLQFGYVDVRDVATAHILAMQNPASNGERFALAEKDLWYKDVAKVLKSNGFDKAPTFAVPVWLAKILANFSKELKITLPYLGRLRSVKNTSKAKDILGWNPRPAEESIVEIAQQIKDMGLIK